MMIRTLLMTSKEKADAIASGDKTFDMVAVGLGVKVGDLIHYNYVSGNTYIKHSIVETIYVVTYVEDLDDGSIAMCLKPAMSYITYVRNLIRAAYTERCRCGIRFNGTCNNEESVIKECGHSHIIILGNDGFDLHREIDDIVDIVIL